MHAKPARFLTLAVLLAGGTTSGVLAQDLTGSGAPPKAAEPAKAPADEPRALDAMPEAVAKLLARSVETMGGAEALAKAADWSMTIRWEEANRKRSGKVVTSGAEKFRFDESREQGPGLVIAMNGEYAWTVLGGRRAIRVGDGRVAPVRRWAEMHRALADLPRRFRSFEHAGEQTFADVPCEAVLLRDKVHVSDVEPYGKYVAYFSKETGRIVGLETPGDRRAEGSDVLRFEEWKTFGDLELFTVVKIRRADGSEETVRYEALAFEPADATLFEVPEAVRNMPAPRKPGDGGPGSLLGAGG